MKNLRTKSVSNKIILTIIFSFIYAIGLYFFIQPANLLTTGIAGVAQIIIKIVPINYGIIYFLINIPGLYLGWRYLGRKLTIYSLASIATVSLVTYFFPILIHDFFPDHQGVISTNPILNSVFGGILMGIGIGYLLKMGSSSGGTDFFALYLLKKRNIEFSKMNLVINILIIFSGTIVNIFDTHLGFSKSMEIMLYTIISLYTRNVMIDQVFTNNQTITLFIVGEDLDRVANYINNKLRRGTTVLKHIEGGYTHSRKEMIMTTLNKYEYSIFIGFIEEVEEPIFITLMESQIFGNYKLDKGVISE